MMQGKEIQDVFHILLATEQEERQMIEDALTDSCPNGFLVSQCETEQELIDKITKEPPDIVFLSLSVNGSHRLQWVRQIRKMQKHLPICVCSDLFSQDIISELVLCGIQAYLPIPIKKVQLQKVLKEFYASIQEKRRQKKEKEEKRSNQAQQRELLEMGFIYTILYGTKAEKQLEAYCEALEIPTQGCMIQVTTADYTMKLEQEKNTIDKVRAYLYANGKDNLYAVGPRIGNRVILYMGIDRQRKTEIPILKGQKDLRCHLEKQLYEYFQIKFNVQVGGVYPIHEIYRSYQDTLRNKSIRKEELKSVGAKNEKYIGHREYVKMVNRLTDSIKFGKDDAEGIFDEILQWMSFMEREVQINKIMELLILCCHEAYMDGQNELQYLDCTLFLKELEDVTDLKKWAHQKFFYVLHAIQTHQERSTSTAVKQALDYIERHFQLEISLDDVANYVGVTPQHFSKIFKLETGRNYVDWITELRIELAKQYLTDGKHTIKEVCYLVGYKDPNYFSRIFKKVQGVTPSEYIRLQP